ncbi:hypothetical protein EMWEY_00055700 [Eimeria maxima]|uniref:Uncharacterized protein n=1 Tax=Eimeria maxima TaxID=5804 RepID=U6M9I6_EIMMA|nr:hypothetical protein EMWEY_00055700 [Eimeria maxima]CDJ59134.1 hypothetical protein EMWEY_00055700 [Eimeria maxima]
MEKLDATDKAFNVYGVCLEMRCFTEGGADYAYLYTHGRFAQPPHNIVDVDIVAAKRCVKAMQLPSSTDLQMMPCYVSFETFGY